MITNLAEAKPCVPPNGQHEVTITVRRQWNDWRTATVRLCDLGGLHWDDESGGVRARSPRQFLHGYMLCTDVLSGDLSHSCRHGKPPHNIKVCVTKMDNTRAGYAAVLAKVPNEGIR